MCGHQLAPVGSIDADAASRQQAFGPRVEDLYGLIQQWQPSRLRFAQRGRRAEASDYLLVLSDVAMNQPLTIFHEIKRVLRETDWNPVRAPAEADEALSQLAEQTLRVLAIVRALAETPPPLELLAVHRESARALSELSQAVGNFIRVLVAPSHEAARQLQALGQSALDRAAANTERISLLIDRLSRIQELGPGWWSIQGAYDTGRVAWEATDRRVTTIANAAELVRQEFTDVPEVALLPDEFAVLLLPAISAASFQDPLRLNDKARLARSLLDAILPCSPRTCGEAIGSLSTRS